ncbi:NUDIX hydrolase [Bacillus spongiae]|uniref:NUDIX hydrolase n=1 Tax=Bacillus spongiae TaxID=2683610 RepID=A0ABU8HIJ9_9BACI
MEYQSPKHIIAVSALVMNEKDEVLLIKTHNRTDTWELPGGQVEEGEPPHLAAEREFFEETGIEMKVESVTGVYYNVTNELLSLVFRGKYIGGNLSLQEEEIKEAKFIPLTEENLSFYITRPHMASRALDALKGTGTLPYEAWTVKPFKQLKRLE